MLHWNNISDDLVRLYHDHNYLYNDCFFENQTKNYFLQPSYNSKYKSNEYIEVDVDSKDTKTDTINLLDSLVNNVSIVIFGNSQDLSFEADEYSSIKSSSSVSNDEWTVSESNLKLKLFEVIMNGYDSLKISSPLEGESYVINFNNLLRGLSKRICRIYASCHWRMDICSLAHCYLLETLPIPPLCVYIETIKLLLARKKIKTILNQLNVWSQNKKLLTRFNWSVLLEYFLQSSQTKDVNLNDSDRDHQISWELDIKYKPTIIHVFAERWMESRRMLSIGRRLRRFSNVIDFRFDDSGRLRRKFEALRNQLQSELKSRRSPVFVIGWDLGALMALLSSIKMQGVGSCVFCGVVSIGLPLKGLKGERGIIPEDYIHLLNKNSLLISGDMSRTGNGDDTADLQDRMSSRVSLRLVNIGGCDHLLRLSSGYALRYRMNQAMVDNVILKEIYRFVCDRIKAMFITKVVKEGPFKNTSSALSDDSSSEINIIPATNQSRSSHSFYNA